MDKLKPILAQKFWILAGLCLILPLVGWWLDTAAMSKEITDRTTAIKGAFSNIPRPGPNQMWTDQVIAKNKEEAAKVIRTGNQLWENRVVLHVWPESVREAVEKTTFRGPIDPTTRGEYRDAYERELEDLHKIVSPFNDYDSTGLVIFPFERIPTLGLGQMITHPSDKITWDAQEDIWLYRTLLEAVARTNAHEQASTILDAIVKEILVIELRGGGPKPTGTTGGGGMPGASPMAGPPGIGAPPSAGAGGMVAPAGGGFGDGMRSGANQGGGALVASFDPAEVFGPDADTAVGTGSTGGPMAPPSAMAGPPKPMGGGPGPMGGGPGPGAGGQFDQSASRKRYIEETKLFNTRGFYMEVVIDHRHVPEFLGELSDSPWPLKIVRIQQVDRDLADIGSSTVGTSMGAAMGPSSGGAAALGMTSAGAGAVKSLPMPVRRPMGGADMEDGGGRLGRTSYSGAGGNFGGNQNGESLIDPNVALADPNLVTLAVAGIITLYLPPEPVAPAPGTPGATPGTPGAIPGAAPGAPATAEAAGTTSPMGTPAAGTTPAPTTPDPATAGAAATTPATGTTPEAAPATGAEPAPAATTPTTTTPAGTTPPGTTPSGTEPAATMPPTTDKPATPEAEPATGEAAAGAPTVNAPATPPAGGTEKK